MIEDPKDSLSTTLVTDSRDWSVAHRDAWIYGIVVGWGSSISGVAKQHGWDRETTTRLQRLHLAFKRLK